MKPGAQPSLRELLRTIFRARQLQALSNFSYFPICSCDFALHTRVACLLFFDLIDVFDIDVQTSGRGARSGHLGASLQRSPGGPLRAKPEGWSTAS